MLNRLQNYMQDRNGFDSLTVFLLICSFILDAFAWFFTPLYIFSIILFATALWRVFSKDLGKRRSENFHFTQTRDDIKDSFENFKFRRQQRKKYKFYKCPNCKNRLRVPRGKGKIVITCPKCGTKFTKKT